jgi:hypothetical protein
VNRSRLLLVAALATLAALAAHQVWRALRPTPRDLSGEDSAAVLAFERELEAEESPERWRLEIGASTVAVDEGAGLVTRTDPAGQVEWSTRLGDNLRSWWWPSLLTDGRLVFVKRQFKGVTALDAATGRVAWDAPVSCACFWLSGDLLVLVHGPQVVGLAAASGAEVFRLSLPTDKDFRPVGVTEAAGLFLVQTHESPDGEGDAFLIDRAGRVRHRLERQVVSVLPSGPDLLLLTSADVRRVSPEGRTVWSAQFESWEWIAHGALMEAPGGDLLAVLYGGIADSGVQVMRFDPASGEVRWRAWCAPLGVSHSEYQHRATAEWDGGRLQVISRGSAGVFVEWLDGETGERLSRGQRSRW